jgi:peptidoglycan hydrolase-like protein with peptidoglycan-binding domain
MAIYARPGSVSEAVKHVQRMLNVLAGTPLVVDGIFGPKTQARVVQFQQQKKLSPDGIVGPLTGNALASEVMKKLLGSA